MAVEARLSIRNLSVSFGTNVALDSLDLDVPAGQIVALLGANGSGKSTTVKALTGINPIHAGAQIDIGGQRLDSGSMTPSETRRRGIRVVHQEAPLIGDLTVADAMAVNLGFPTRGGFIRTNRLTSECAQLLAEFDIDIDPYRLCQTLSAPERALVSLAIALAGISVDSAVLVLDEASASLSTTEAQRFLDRVRAAADRGLAVLMVTHRLPEVRQYCDQVTVLRDGHAVARFDRQSFDEHDVVRAMVGADAAERVDRASGTTASTDLAMIVRDFTADAVDAVSFDARAGEILGLAGRAGGGASEILRLIGGVDKPASGTIELRGAHVPLTGPRAAIARGIFYISADRLSEGGVPTMSVAENLTLPRFERYGLGRRRARLDVDRMMMQLDIRPPDATVPFGSLSGGNQQKVLLARWLLLEPVVLLLDDPTVGVDPNTREVMFAVLRDLAASGTTVLLRSSEPEQLARLCSRVLIIGDHRLVGELSGDRLTTEEISLATFA